MVHAVAAARVLRARSPALAAPRRRGLHLAPAPQRRFRLMHEAQGPSAAPLAGPGLGARGSAGGGSPGQAGRKVAAAAAAAVVAGALGYALYGEAAEESPAAAAAAVQPCESERRAEAELLAACRQIVGEQATAEYVDSGRVHSCHANTFAANIPIEDRYSVEFGGNGVPGTLVGVYDGHTGSAASQFCQDELLGYVARDWARRGGGDAPVLSKAAFVEADGDFLDRAWASEQPTDGLAGACVTVAHVGGGGTVQAANAGDCRAVLGRRDPGGGGGGWEAVELTRDHELRHNQDERERLLREHPDEPDLLRRDRVKGHLQPTRGLGDGTYKRDEYFRMRPRYVRRHSTWTPPYTTAEPELSTYRLGKDDAFLVLATDGLFEDLSSQQVVELLGRYCDEHRPASRPAALPENVSPAAAVPANAATWLVEQALVAASKSERFFPQGDVPDARHLAYVLRNVPDAKRRRVHDDVTCVVLFFGADEDGTAAGDNRHGRVAERP